MKYQIEKATNKIVGIYFDEQDVENWEVDWNIYEIKQSLDSYHTLNESLEWVIDKEKVNQRLSEIDQQCGLRYIRDFFINNLTMVNPVALEKIQVAENEAVSLRNLLY